MEYDFGRVCIDGVGLLGGSLGLALKERGLTPSITGAGRNEKRLQSARERGLIDEVLTHERLEGEPWDVLVLAAPVGQIGRCLHRHLEAGLIDDRTAVTDVGSTKRRLAEECTQILGGRSAQFVGAHPIAGSEKSGAGHADATLYQDRVTILTPDSSTGHEFIDRVRRFWESVGSRILVLSAERHDEILATSSHLPHITAAALCLLASDCGAEVKEVLGSGFRDATRIASGSAEMWRDISLHNRQALSGAVAQLRMRLKEFEGLLQDEREVDLLEYFQQAKVWRDEALS